MAMALTEAQKAAAFQSASPELRFLLDRDTIPEDIQANLFHAGVTTLRQLAAIASDPEDVKKMMKDDLGIDPTGGLQNRVLVSKIVVAWESARARSTKHAEAEAEAELRQEPKVLRTTDFRAMKDAWEKKWWPLEDRQIPAKSYLE